MKIIIFYLILLFPSAFYAQEVPKLRIDPSKAYGGNVSDYFDSVEYIPLETTKESLFGDVGKLIITDSSYVIKDNDTKCILFFLLNGKFIKKIKMNENSDYAVFYEKSENQLAIYKKIFTSPDFSVQYYSLQGNPLPVKTRNSGLINDERIPIGIDYWIKFSSCYYLPRTAAKDTNIFLLQIYKNNQVAKSFLPFNPKNNLAFCALAYGNLRFSNIYDETAFYVSIPLEHTVYKVNKDTAVKLFQFIFPSDRSINKHILESKDEKYIDSLRGAKWHNVNTIISVNNILIKKDLIFFKTDAMMYVSLSHGSESTIQHNFIFNTATQKLISMERMVPDMKSYYLPIIDASHYFQIYGLQYYGNHMFSSLSSLQMFAAREATKSKKPQYAPVLQEYFKTQNRKSNPVIVKMKLKEL